MMDLNAPAIAVSGVTLSLRELLMFLRQRRQLRPLLVEAVLDKLLRKVAKVQGISVDLTELQRAADRFRAGQGLNSAENTRQWLAGEGLTVQDFEAGLERELLRTKWQEHLAKNQLADHFAAHQDDYTQARLLLIRVDREDLAKELWTQLQEGGDFPALARAHSRHRSGASGGALGTVLRRQLPPALAAAIFAASPGSVVGPFAQPEGFDLYLVESIKPAELTDELAVMLGQELFASWLKEKLSEDGMTLTLPPWDAV